MRRGTYTSPVSCRVHPEPPAISLAEHAHREAMYEAMAKLLGPLEQRAVLIVFDPGTIEAHVMVHDPGTEEAQKVLLTGQQALYALSLYTMRLEADLAAAQDHARQS